MKPQNPLSHFLLPAKTRIFRAAGTNPAAARARHKSRSTFTPMTLSSRPNWTLAIGLPLLVIMVCVVVSLSTAFSLHPDAFSTGITLDLTLTAPLLYFLVIRKSAVPKMTTIRVFIVGVLVAGLLLQHRFHSFLTGIRTWVPPLVEAMVFFLIGRKLYAVRKKGGARQAGDDFLSRCRMVVQEVIGNERLSGLMASEIATFYYGFISRPARDIDYRSRFSMYKDNGIRLILGVFICCFFVETAGLHLLVALWSVRLAWVLTALGLYTALQLHAHRRALTARPVLLTDDCLYIRNGLAGEARIPFDLIEHIMRAPRPLPASRRPSASTATPGSPITSSQLNKAATPVASSHRGKTAKEASTDPVRLTLLKGMENPNMLVHVKCPVQVTRLFGIRRPATSILFYVDKPTEFLDAIRAKLAASAG